MPSVSFLKGSTFRAQGDRGQALAAPVSGSKTSMCPRRTLTLLPCSDEAPGPTLCRQEQMLHPSLSLCRGYLSAGISRHCVKDKDWMRWQMSH